MKLYDLYIHEDVEDAKSGGQKAASVLGRIVMGALKGIARLGQLLGGLIIRGMVGKSIANGNIKPSKAMKAYKADTTIRSRRALEKIDDPELQHKIREQHTTIDKKYDEISTILERMEEFDEEAAKQMGLRVDETHQNFIEAVENGDEMAMRVLEAAMNARHKEALVALEKMQDEGEGEADELGSGEVDTGAFDIEPGLDAPDDEDEFDDLSEIPDTGRIGQYEWRLNPDGGAHVIDYKFPDRPQEHELTDDQFVNLYEKLKAGEEPHLGDFYDSSEWAGAEDEEEVEVQA